MEKKPINNPSAEERNASPRPADETQAQDRAGLLQVARMIFPEILSVNLTQGTYRMIQYYGATTVGTPVTGPLDQMLGMRLPNVAPEDQGPFREKFFKEGLRRALERGEKRVSLTYRRTGQDGEWHWLETTAIPQENPENDDLLVMAVSRSVDAEKEQELRLRQALADSSAQLDDLIYYTSLSRYNYPGLDYISYEDGRESPYTSGRLPGMLGCDAASLAMCTSERIPQEDRAAFEKAYAQAVADRAATFYAEYRVEMEGEEVAWVANRAVRFVDREGDVGHMHFLADTSYEHALAEQVRVHMEARIAETEQVFNVVAQHSDRILYAYDLETRTTRPWNAANQERDILAPLYTGIYSEQALERNPFVLADSVEEIKRFFQEIHEGKPAGEVKLHVSLPEDGRRRWYHFKYSSIFSGEQPVTALISIEDITERHEQEVSHLRLSSMGADEKRLGYLEADLTTDFVEKHVGDFLINSRSFEGERYSEYWEQGFSLFAPEDLEQAKALYSREALLGRCRQGIRALDHVWKLAPGGKSMWVRIRIQLMEDPISRHGKVFGTLMDVTDEQEERIAVSRRADFDSMTGLLRREAGEALIQEHLAEQDANGILIALDLDDLKGINDTLGHAEGDIAIIGIADMMRRHFRRGDILVRAGGDEFLAYLPGAGRAVSSVQLSLTALLRKLSGITVGDNAERSIHCSIGCAVVEPGDTYESLFKRADVALYHVKRNGKNNVAFFEPEMLQANYAFKRRQAVPIPNREAREEELAHMLEVVSTIYPGIVLLNLTQDQSKVLSVGSNVAIIPTAGKVEDFWEECRRNVHPDDLARIGEIISCPSLLTRYAEGQRRETHYYRNREVSGYMRTELTVHYFTSDQGDICAFLFFRWDTAPEQVREVQRLKKILELSVKEDFEYVCLINVIDHGYTTISREEDNSHAVPNAADFDLVTQHVRDTQVAPEEREAYFEKANLDHVLAHMQTPESVYSYRYTMRDGVVREAVFHWYEESRSELLMTVSIVK